MNIKISNDDQSQNVTAQLNNQAVKAFQILLMREVREIDLKIQRDQQKNFQQKIIPFYLKNFVSYLHKNESQSEITQIQGLLKYNQLNLYSVEFLIRIFQEKQYKNLQEKWIDYMKKQALVDVIQNIKSKKIRIIYLQKLDSLKKEISIYKNPYFFLFKIPNEEQKKLLLKCEYVLKTEAELFQSMQPTRKMIIHRIKNN